MDGVFFFFTVSQITLKMDGFIFANSTDSDETLRSTMLLRTGLHF